MMKKEVSTFMDLRSFLRSFVNAPLTLPASWYALPLRLIIGYGFMEHGYAKLARGPESFTAILHAIGTPAPALMAWATICVELLGGLAVLLGGLIRLASIPMAIVLFVAIATVHLPYGFSSIKLLSVDAAGAHFGQPGYETDLLYIAGLVALVIGGTGPLALDKLLLRKSKATVRASPLNRPTWSEREIQDENQRI
jgi:putative oxidoreductase